MPDGPYHRTVDLVRVWLAVAPIVAAGVLVSHELAYRLTGTPSGALHAYLDHAPQVLLMLLVVGLASAGLASRLRAPAAWPIPLAALAGFVVQEQVERLVHAGEPASVLTPAFLVGLALQVPVAVLAWAVARWLLGALVEPGRRPAAVPAVSLGLVLPPASRVCAAPARRATSRGPPSGLRR